MQEQQEQNGLSALLPGERVDEIGFGGLRLIQKPEEFCYGVDAVLLADFAAGFCKKGDQVGADLGTGCGIIPLILSCRTTLATLYGVEIQEGAWNRAVRSAGLNGLTDRLRFVLGDVKAVADMSWSAALQSRVDLVTCNPPYMAESSGLTNSNTAKRIARHETTAGLKDFLACGAALLRERGNFCMVHRPARLVDLCCLAREQGLEVKHLRFVSPNRNAAPNIMLVHMTKGGGAALKMLPPLYVYEEDGTYTAALRAAYRTRQMSSEQMMPVK